MRVPNLSLYSNTNYQLNFLTNDMSDANEVMATQKQINAIGDDPIGFSQVLDLGNSIKNLEQYNSNIDMGITWLNGSETALQTVQDQILTAKTLALQLANASASTTQRADAVETIEGIIDQIMAMGNTQVNGSYIFGGTETETEPFEYDDADDPTGIIYSGNDSPFTIQSNSATTLEVGRDGESMFAETEITVDASNNRIFFREDPGEGENAKETLEATIPDGTYTPEELAVIVKNVMNQASEDNGYGITYTVSYNSDDETFTIINDGSYDGYMRLDLLWESGEEAMISNISTEGILAEGVNIEVVDADALIHETPDDGSAPIRLTWDEEDGVWSVLNDPGYGLATEVDGSDDYVALDLTGDDIADIIVTMEAPATDGEYVEFDIIAASEEHSIGPDMGFTSGDVSYSPLLSDDEVVLKTFDSTNRVIDFREDAGSGLSTQLSAVIPDGDYTDMDELATAIESAMETASANNINYDVDWDDDANKFTIAGSSLTELQLLWNSGTNATTTAATELGYDTAADDAGATSYAGDNQVALFTITTGSNDTINFKEILPGGSEDETVELTATIAAGSYYDVESLARAVEDALEDASADYGNRVDYDVSYVYNSQKFSIEEDGTLGRQLEDIALLWESGDDAEKSAASTLGFYEVDISAPPAEGDPVAWGIFETLFDLKEYLAADDVDGIQRTITRLDTHYESVTSVLSDIGMKYDRLTTIQQVSNETVLSLTERKSMIEDADFAEAVMNLTAIQTAYEASLSSTAKIINISLVDYM